MFDGVVLDVDDTLYLERDYVCSGFEAVDKWLATQIGVPGIGSVAWELFLNGVRRTTISDALRLVLGAVDKDILNGCIRVYREHDPRISILPDARFFIECLCGTVPLAVVTDGPAASQRAKCRALGLFDLCQPVVLTEELGMSKPDVRVFEAAVQNWPRRAPDALIYVADNPQKDFWGPLALGWRALRVRRPGSLYYDVGTPSGVHEIETLSEFDGLGR